MSDTPETKKSSDTPNFKEVMLKTRSLLLTGEVNKETPAKIVPQLLMLEALDPNAPIYLFIDSPGGEVDSGLAVYNAIRFVSCPVYTVGLGLIASIAAIIFLAPPLERRIALPFNRYLLHQPLGGMRGVVTDIEIHAKEMERTKAELAQIIADATGRNLKDVVDQTDRDYWLSATEAKEYGLVGNLVAKRADLDALVKSH
jgi:ATP-dependent Clp protease protease subunit